MSLHYSFELIQGLRSWPNSRELNSNVKWFIHSFIGNPPIPSFCQESVLLQGITIILQGKDITFIWNGVKVNRSFIGMIISIFHWRLPVELSLVYLVYLVFLLPSEGWTRVQGMRRPTLTHLFNTTYNLPLLLPAFQTQKHTGRHTNKLYQ